MKKYKVGVIGLGGRGAWWVTEILANLSYVQVTGLCDSYQDRIDSAKDKLVESGYDAPPVLTKDYKELISSDAVEVVLVFSAWSNHFDAVLYSMNAEKPVATEVGGAYAVEQCWELVRAYQRTNTPFMMLENCCFGEYELMTLNMAKQGIFGDIVHCAGSYGHDLRNEISFGNENRHYRFNEYLHRNCENYPTHEIGPIAKVLGINNGNRFESLVSVSSCARGLHEYIISRKDLKDKYGDVIFKQGDIVSTTIKCAGGETVSITLDTTLPRYYSRNFTVRGTKGMYEEATHSVFIDGEDYSDAEWDWAPRFCNRDAYKKQWMHPIWRWYTDDGVKELGHVGHDGMDFLVIDAFFEALDKGLPMPVDVYDAATWMVITALSEKSIALGSRPVAFPDFTEGKWKYKKEEFDWKYKF